MSLPLTQKFNVNVHRKDPYRSSNFRVKIDGKYVAGVSKATPLKATIEPISWRAGGDPSTSRQLSGTAKYEAVTLEDGVTHDDTFRSWFSSTSNPSTNLAISLVKQRKDITIELLNEMGQVAQSFTLLRCWPSEFQALPELDANGNAVAIRSLKLEYEGWLDNSSEPTET